MKTVSSSIQLLRSDEDIPADALSVVVDAHLAEPTAIGLIDSFRGSFAAARPLIEQAKKLAVTDATQVTEIKAARILRLKLRDIRCEADATRKALKENSQREGNAIQGVFNILKFLIEPVEEKLQAAEAFAERAEAARKTKLKAEREEALRPYAVNTAFYVLGDMPEGDFAALLASARTAYEAQQAAAAKAETDRLAKIEADKIERAGLEEENARLREQKRRADEAAAIQQRAADAQAARLKKESDTRLAAERRAADEKARVAAETARTEREAVEATARKEREARYEAEAALKKKEAEAAQAVAAEAAKVRKAARAPDADKLRAFAGSIRSLELPNLTTPEGKDLTPVLAEQITKFAAWVDAKAAQL